MVKWKLTFYPAKQRCLSPWQPQTNYTYCHVKHHLCLTNTMQYNHTIGHWCPKKLWLTIFMRKYTKRENANCCEPVFTKKCILSDDWRIKTWTVACCFSMCCDYNICVLQLRKSYGFFKETSLWKLGRSSLKEAASISNNEWINTKEYSFCQHN